MYTLVPFVGLPSLRLRYDRLQSVELLPVSIKDEPRPFGRQWSPVPPLWKPLRTDGCFPCRAQEPAGRVHARTQYHGRFSAQSVSGETLHHLCRHSLRIFRVTAQAANSASPPRIRPRTSDPRHPPAPSAPAAPAPTTVMETTTCRRPLLARNANVSTMSSPSRAACPLATALHSTACARFVCIPLAAIYVGDDFRAPASLTLPCRRSRLDQRAKQLRLHNDVFCYGKK